MKLTVACRNTDVPRWTLMVLSACVWFIILTRWAAAQPVATVRANDESQLQQQLALGQRIYREGVGISGEPLKAITAAQVVLSGQAAACATCHRRSGYGANEGQFTIRPITGPALFEAQTVVIHSPRIKAQLGSRQRPPYTEALLARALRIGLDSAAKPLDPVMPRYALSDEELKAVVAYLSTLSVQSSPGVDEQEIHFATVMQPGVEPAKQRAMLSVMQTFFRDKGASVRSEEQRREAGTMRMYRSYRKWVLHVWELSGSSETWEAQLETFYRQQPVFALISGLGGASWSPIHDFSERFEIPAVFPQVDLPVTTGANHFNFYLSRGMALDAEVLAKFLHDQGDSGKIVQVYRRNEVGLVASAAFRKALPAGVVIQDLVLDGVADESFWHQVAQAQGGTLVLWLDAKDLQAEPYLGGRVSGPVYLSFDLLDGLTLPTSLAQVADVRMVYPSDLSPKHASRMLRATLWLHGKGMAITDEPVQINTLFAMTVVSDALGHMMDSFSRDYFVERVEHVVGQTPMPSLFQSVSLGSGQRFAAKGRSIVKLDDASKEKLKSLSGWLIP